MPEWLWKSQGVLSVMKGQSFRCTNIYKSYHLKKSILPVLNGINISLKAGEIGMLMGSSGCGKTTLLMIAGGILAPDQGSCEVNGHDLFTMDPQNRVKFRATHISFIFQILIYFLLLLQAKMSHYPY